MSKDLGQRLREEMASQDRPPADTLVAGAVQRGRQQRRARRLGAGLGTGAVVGITVLAVTVGGAVLPHRAASTASLSAGSSSAGSSSVAPPVSAAAPTTAGSAASPVETAAAATTTVPPKPAAGTTAAPAGLKHDKAAAAKSWRSLQSAKSAEFPPQWSTAPAGVPATPQAELLRFSELAKPYGDTSEPGVSEDSDKTHVRTYLTAADGKVGMLQWSMRRDTLGYEADCMKAPAAFLATFSDLGFHDPTCRHTDDGGYIVENHVDAGCLEAADLTVVHPDGTAIDVSVASCLTDFNNDMHPGSQTLTMAQAEAIFQDPSFDFTMPSDLVARGAQLGQLRTFW